MAKRTNYYALNRDKPLKEGDFVRRVVDDYYRFFITKAVGDGSLEFRSESDCVKLADEPSRRSSNEKVLTGWIYVSPLHVSISLGSQASVWTVLGSFQQ